MKAGEGKETDSLVPPKENTALLPPCFQANEDPFQPSMTVVSVNKFALFKP